MDSVSNNCRCCITFMTSHILLAYTYTCMQTYACLRVWVIPKEVFLRLFQTIFVSSPINCTCPRVSSDVQFMIRKTIFERISWENLIKGMANHRDGTRVLFVVCEVMNLLRLSSLSSAEPECARYIF